MWRLFTVLRPVLDYHHHHLRGYVLPGEGQRPQARERVRLRGGRLRRHGAGGLPTTGRGMLVRIHIHGDRVGFKGGLCGSSVLSSERTSTDASSLVQRSSWGCLVFKTVGEEKGF